MEIKKILLTENGCYKAARIMIPSGIVIHSTGANNPYISRYVQPDDGLIGKNKYGNHWNRKEATACVHGFIGLDTNSNVTIRQTLPYNYKPWGCASGNKGSFNNSHIQFEICEDNLTDKNYFTEVYNKAAEFCAYLCKQFDISINNIVSHAEAYKAGYASNHRDIDHWFIKFGKTMNDFRSAVSFLINKGTEASKPEPTNPIITTSYKVRVTDSSLNIRKGSGTNFDIVGKITDKGVYTIVEEATGSGATKWGKLKSGAGWISLDYCKKIESENQSEQAKPIYTPKEGDKVTVTGNLYSNREGGNKIVKNSSTMYIYKIYNAGTYPIAFIKTKGGKTVNGYGNKSVIQVVQ